MLKRKKEVYDRGTHVFLRFKCLKKNTNLLTVRVKVSFEMSSKSSRSLRKHVHSYSCTVMIFMQAIRVVLYNVSHSFSFEDSNTV